MFGDGFLVIPLKKFTLLPWHPCKRVCMHYKFLKHKKNINKNK